MGKLDTMTKQYMSQPEIFADAFNYLLYNGERVIMPDALRSVDTTEIITPYGNGAKTPIQKYRDNMKIWAAMHDGRAVYVLLGSENQSKVHYTMPVKDMLYDSLNYAAQVDAARRSFKELKFDDDGVKITLSKEEFLSGFRKGDKLIPVITAVVLFNPDEWDAPLSIHEMLDVDERLLPFIPDYKINLIAPARIDESDFTSREHEGKFHTGFGTLMQVIKHKNEKSVHDVFLKSPLVDTASADIIEEISNVKFKRVYDEKGDVDMCLGMELHDMDMRIEGVIDYLRDEGIPEEQIAERVAKKFNVSIDYVKNLMMPKAV